MTNEEKAEQLAGPHDVACERMKTYSALHPERHGIADACICPYRSEMVSRIAQALEASRAAGEREAHLLPRPHFTPEPELCGLCDREHGIVSKACLAHEEIHKLRGQLHHWKARALAAGRAERDGEVDTLNRLIKEHLQTIMHKENRIEEEVARAEAAEARCDRLEGQKRALVSARVAVTEELGRVASLLYRNGLKEEARELDKFLLAHRTIRTLPLLPSEPSSGGK